LRSLDRTDAWWSRQSGPLKAIGSTKTKDKAGKRRIKSEAVGLPYPNA
jgi:hypothetical protein